MCRCLRTTTAYLGLTRHTHKGRLSNKHRNDMLAIVRRGIRIFSPSDMVRIPGNFFVHEKFSSPRRLWWPIFCVFIFFSADTYVSVVHILQPVNTARVYNIIYMYIFYARRQRRCATSSIVTKLVCSGCTKGGGGGGGSVQEHAHRLLRRTSHTRSSHAQLRSCATAVFRSSIPFVSLSSHVPYVFWNTIRHFRTILAWREIHSTLVVRRDIIIIHLRCVVSYVKRRVYDIIIATRTSSS